ncbi:MAG: hypothetical protein AUI14_05780 [Actinobacteria bacterium 13_2_20CM_2_71_6]|nr:MAG: hypothetical protein AUI14_05780 [Actinobacteria bacterium 13_2_20CM_2_71_6]
MPHRRDQQRQPDHVGQEPGYHQQQPAEQAHRAVTDLRPDRLPLLGCTAQRAPGPDPLPAQQPAAQQRGGQHDQHGHAHPELVRDQHEQRDLRGADREQRDHDQAQSPLHGASRRWSISGVPPSSGQRRLPPNI